MNETSFYDAALKLKSDIVFYKEAAKEHSKGSILEVGCGTGRILLEIAKDGLAVDGLECNEERLSICRKNLAALGEEIQKNVSLYQCFSNDFKTDKKYSVIFLPFRVLQEMGDVVSQEKSLRHLKSLLMPDGVLILDVWNPDLSYLVKLQNNLNQKLETKDFTDAQGRMCKVSFRPRAVDFQQQTFSAEKVYEYEENGKNREEVYSWNSRYLMRYEVEYLPKHH